MPRFRPLFAQDAADGEHAGARGADRVADRRPAPPSTFSLFSSRRTEGSRQAELLRQ